MSEVRAKIPFTSKVEIECENLNMAKEAMRVGADIVMCDNMSNKSIKEVVEFRNKYYPHILLEASGNVSLDTIEEIAKTGVDAISSGSLIHQANWIDLSMKIGDIEIVKLIKSSIFISIVAYSTTFLKVKQALYS